MRIVRNVGAWLDEVMLTGDPLYAKRLPHAAVAIEGDPAGLFVPRQVMYRVSSKLFWAGRVDPTVPIEMAIDSHPHVQTIRAVWYNSEHHGGDRNETRLLGFDGPSVLADDESTGALAIFAFRPETREEPPTCRVWICETAAEEDLVEDRIGPVEPGRDVFWPHIFERLDRPEYSVDRPEYSVDRFD